MAVSEISVRGRAAGVGEKSVDHDGQGALASIGIAPSASMWCWKPARHRVTRSRVSPTPGARPPAAEMFAAAELISVTTTVGG